MSSAKTPCDPSTQTGLDHFFNEDCVEGSQRHIADDSVDLLVTDPPYGISGDTLHKHYNRNEDFVIDGYVEVPRSDYPSFSRNWIRQAERVLRPGGSLYIVSGYTNLIHILNALSETNLQEVNHLIWKFNFGVFTQRKYVSSHYHILYYTKPGGEVTFNTYSRYGNSEKSEDERSLNYRDREDVWVINKEYKPGRAKNKNELPTELLIKMVQYSSNEGDLVFDFFLGSFSTAKVARGLNRRCGGFEISQAGFEHQLAELHEVSPGSLLEDLRVPEQEPLENQGKLWTESEREKVFNRYLEIRGENSTKKSAIGILCQEFGRGRFAIGKVIDEFETR